ncbi:MAG: hypothetical protein Q8N36_00375, partial [bacterium]|nr:hypothetical protein [bacterium]
MGKFKNLVIYLFIAIAILGGLWGWNRNASRQKFLNSLPEVGLSKASVGDIRQTLVLTGKAEAV